MTDPKKSSVPGPDRGSYVDDFDRDALVEKSEEQKKVTIAKKTRTDTQETLSGERTVDDFGQPLEEKAPQSTEKTKASDDEGKSEPAEPAEPATSEPAEPAASGGEATTKTSKPSGGFGTLGDLFRGKENMKADKERLRRKKVKETETPPVTPPTATKKTEPPAEPPKTSESPASTPKKKEGEKKDKEEEDEKKKEERETMAEETAAITKLAESEEFKHLFELIKEYRKISEKNRASIRNRKVDDFIEHLRKKGIDPVEPDSEKKIFEALETMIQGENRQERIEYAIAEMNRVLPLVIRNSQPEEETTEAPEAEPETTEPETTEPETTEPETTEPETETVPEPEADATPEPEVDAASEREATVKLKHYLNQMTAGNAALADLRKRLENIFEILEADLSELQEEDREYLESIQAEMRIVLLSEIPKAVAGMSDCNNLTELFEKMRAPGQLRRNKAAMSPLSDALTKDSELSEIINDFYRIAGIVNAAEEIEDVEDTEETEEEPTDAGGDSATETEAEEEEEAEEEKAGEEVAIERTPMPADLMEEIEALAAGDETLKKRLLDLWEVRCGKAKLDNEEKTQEVKKHMEVAQKLCYIDQSMVQETLEEVLEMAEGYEIIFIGPDSGTPPDDTGGGGAIPDLGTIDSDAGGASNASGSESSASDSDTDIDASTSSESASSAEATDYFSSPEVRLKATNVFMARLGFPIGNKSPEVMAIRMILEQKVYGPKELAQLQAFLDSAKFEDEAEKKYGKIDLKELKRLRAEKQATAQTLNARTRALSRQLERASTEEEQKKITAALTPLNLQKEELQDDLKDLETIIQRKSEKKETEKQRYKGSPVKLLGMINYYFAKAEADSKNEVPDYELIASQTQAQIEVARNRERSENWKAKFISAFNRLSPHSFFKPRLTSTLVAIAEKDASLKIVTPEMATALAKTWDDSDGVKQWIVDLPGNDEENMKTIVPRLIGHLALVTNNGRLANINSVSLNRARGLLDKLRRARHEHAIEKAGEGGAKDSLDRVHAYFDQLNAMSKKEAVSGKIVEAHSRGRMWENMKSTAKYSAIAGGIGVGAVQIASLSGIALGATLAASASGVMMGSSFRVEKPETKAMLRKFAARTLVAGGLGAVALGVASPWLAAPVGAAAAVGLFTPEVWKNRMAIWQKTKKYGPGALHATGWVARRTAGLALSCGVFLAWPRWRKWFGLPFPGK